MNAILLPHVLEYNYIAAPEKYRQIAECLGENTAGLSTHAASRLTLKAVKELVSDLEVPQSLSAIGLHPEQIDLLSSLAVLDVCMTTNPRDMTVHDVATLFRQAL